jgi:hypothetical protein
MAGFHIYGLLAARHERLGAVAAFLPRGSRHRAALATQTRMSIQGNSGLPVWQI